MITKIIIKIMNINPNPNPIMKALTYNPIMKALTYNPIMKALFFLYCYFNF